MSDDKGFLSRWSQRKREAKQPEPKQDTPAVGPDNPSEQALEGEAAPEFDLSSLPKLEDITGTTDVTAFLRKGVPESLRNAALRKSWALDPAIRNYVNPALEYAYDWNTPGGVPGSSEIGAGMDVARLVSQIMGSDEPVVESSMPDVEPPAARSSDHIATQEQESVPELPTQTLRLGDQAISIAQGSPNAEQGDGIEAEQQDGSMQSRSAAPQQTVRRHGSAKPLD